MTAIEEPLVPGAYTVTELSLYIRPSMNTINAPVGQYRNGDSFTVFEVYPEKDGVVWGRVSSAIGAGSARFVGLRVNNHLKVRLELRFEDLNRTDLSVGIASLTAAIRELTALLRNK